MSDIKKISLQLHQKYKGKLETKSKVSLNSPEDLAWAYSPGVAEPCKMIQNNPQAIYDYTSKGNMVGVITDGSAVLGLGNIGAKASLPVMEGKAILLKEFANVDAFPICLDTNDTEEIIRTCQLISPSLGGINLEDISAPKCVEIERRLQKLLDIPVFHDDQHGTAIVTLAALFNALKLTNKDISDLKVVLCGTGAAGSSIARLLNKAGVHSIKAYNKDGIVSMTKYDTYDFVIQELLDEEIIHSHQIHEDSLSEIIKDSDVFIGVSVGNILTKTMVQSMASNPFVFAMANPEPEINPIDAKAAGARIIGTGRSDYPNQINNVLAFPGIFRGVLDAKARNVTENMKIAAAKSIADIIPYKELHDDYIVPSPFNKNVVTAVADAIKKEVSKENNEL